MVCQEQVLADSLPAREQELEKQAHQQQALVIIPTYNRAGLLPEAIDSALAQDYPYTKLVVVDDGSSDHTQSVCAAFIQSHGSRVSYLYKENGGCASARNRGLELINDDIGYVCFLDSDDRLLRGKLSREVELLRTNPGADFTYADSILYDESTQREQLRKVAAAGRSEDFAIQHFLTNEAKSGALLYRASVCRGRRFHEDLRYNEDSEFLQRVAIEHRGVYSSGPSCWVRWHAGSKSRNSVEIQKAVLQVSLDILKSYPSFYSSFAKQADRRVKEIRGTLLRELVLQGRWSEAELYATSIPERFLVANRLSPYYRLRRCVGLTLTRNK